MSDPTPYTIADLRAGVRRFKKRVFPRHREFFQVQEEGQQPEILFIGCIDSRVDPALICDCDAGDMFVERTPGNIVPVYDDGSSVGVAASVEFAVAKGVEHIIVCGHSDCGALRGALDPESLRDLPAVRRWVEHAAPAVRALKNPGSLEELCQLNVLQQLDHLRQHPSVAARLADRKLELHGWVYGIGSGEILQYNSASREFVPWPED